MVVSTLAAVRRLFAPITVPLFDSQSDGYGKKHTITNDRWETYWDDLGKELRLIPRIVSGTHAERANCHADEYPAGTLFLETDRSVMYRAAGPLWYFLQGTMVGTLAEAPTDLGEQDAGLRYSVSDYSHIVMWTGVSWAWTDDDGGNGFYQEFHSAPTGSGWILSTGAVNTTKLKVGAVLEAEVVLTRAAAAVFDAANSVFFRR